MSVSAVAAEVEKMAVGERTDIFVEVIANGHIFEKMHLSAMGVDSAPARGGLASRRLSRGRRLEWH